MDTRILTIPSGTRIEERTIVAPGDVLIGDHCEIGFGVIADTLIAGERVSFDGDVKARDEVRIDLWSQVDGSVESMEDVYLGEFVHITGKLVVQGDLDIGNDVQIDGGFEAKGWIVIRNPVPIMVYVFLYLMELLRLGKSEEVERVLEEIIEDEYELEDAMNVPKGARVNTEMIRTSDSARVGDDCRLIGNLRALDLVMGDSTTLFGSIRTRDDVIIGEECEVHGNIVSKGTVKIGRGSKVLGEINAQEIEVHETAQIDGAMRAPVGVRITRDEEEAEGDGKNEYIDLEI